jgi:hypothetical protein
VLSVSLKIDKIEYRAVVKFFLKEGRANNKHILSISRDIMAISVLIHGCERWNLSKQHNRRTEKAENEI